MLSMYDMRIKDTTGLSMFKHLESLEINDINYRSDLDEKTLIAYLINQEDFP